MSSPLTTSQPLPRKLLAWLSHRQGLDGHLAHLPLADVLAQVGWMRSVGGCGPYVGLFARTGASRAQVDAALADVHIHELPSARGCTYVLGHADFATGLRVAQGFADDATRKVARKLGVTDAELTALEDKLCDVLRDAALTTEQLRDAVGPLARSLGEEGKKKGMTTTLPVALGGLQTAGRLRRIPIDGRLDQQRYKYTAWRENPLQKEQGEPFVQLARQYAGWIGPFLPSEFQWFSGLGVKASQSALAALPLVDVGEGRLLLPEHLDAYQRFEMPSEPQFALVSSLDNLTELRRDLAGLLPSEEAAAKVASLSAEGAGASLMGLPCHAIVDRGQVVGVWEFDTATQAIVWHSFVGKPQALVDAVARTQAYVRDELGDARGFSLDSPKSRVEKLARIRALG